jgi:hypothetical protein
LCKLGEGEGVNDTKLLARQLELATADKNPCSAHLLVAKRRAAVVKLHCGFKTLCSFIIHFESRLPVHAVDNRRACWLARIMVS